MGLSPMASRHPTRATSPRRRTLAITYRPIVYAKSGRLWARWDRCGRIRPSWRAQFKWVHTNEGGLSCSKGYSGC